MKFNVFWCEPLLSYNTPFEKKTGRTMESDAGAKLNFRYVYLNVNDVSEKVQTLN